jgi:hypothetical protein
MLVVGVRTVYLGKEGARACRNPRIVEDLWIAGACWRAYSVQRRDERLKDAAACQYTVLVWSSNEVRRPLTSDTAAVRPRKPLGDSSGAVPKQLR